MNLPKFGTVIPLTLTLNMRKLLFLLWLIPGIAYAQGSGVRVTSEAQHPLRHKADKIVWDNTTTIYAGNVTVATDIIVSGTGYFNGSGESIFPSGVNCTGSNVTADYFIGDGSLLTGIATTATGITVQKNGADVGSSTRVNLIEGSAITLTVANSSYGLNVTYAATGSGTGNVTQSNGVVVDHFPAYVSTTVIKDSGVSAASFQTVLTNSAGLRGALSDETGTNYAVFNTSPTITTATLKGTTEADGFFNASNLNCTNANFTTLATGQTVIARNVTAYDTLTVPPAWYLNKGSIGMTFDGNNATLVNGSLNRKIVVPWNCSVTEWQVWANHSGSIVTEVWYHPSRVPTVADMISTGAHVTLSTQESNSSNVLHTWSTALKKNGIVAFNVTSNSINWSSCRLQVRREE